MALATVEAEDRKHAPDPSDGQVIVTGRDDDQDDDSDDEDEEP